MIKKLVLDVETAPNVAHVWGLFKQDVSLNQLQEASYMLSCAAKWHGQKKVYYWDIRDENMVSNVHALVDEADAVIHWNGDSFDMPVLNREFITDGLPPPSPYKNIDVMKIVAKKFRFASNKLDHVAKQLGVTQKLKNSGHELWVGVMNGDEKAWREMKRYNIGDLHPLEEIYDIVLPWADGHPNLQLYADGHVCPRCGVDGEHLTKQGFAFTNTGKFQRYLCGKCGAWSRSNKRIEGVTEQGAL